MNYPTREHLERILEDLKQTNLETTIIHLNYKNMLDMHDEIDRLTAMLPKVVVPKISEPMGDYYTCDCGLLVGITYLSIEENWTSKYCQNCGARMDWDKAREVET
jgi:hypothetical protein